MLFGGRRSAAVVLCLAFLMTGCLARRRVITRKGGAPDQALLTASKENLLSRIESFYASIDTLNATVDMVPALGTVNKGEITEYKDVRGYVLFRKPGDIRIIGLYPVVRNKAFDMVSTDGRFKVYIPARNRFITGEGEVVQPSKKRIENLRPSHFLTALLVRPLQNGERAVLENITDEETATYVLHLVRETPGGELIPSRAIQFDRLTLALERQLIFDEGGDILTDARYRNWQTFGDVRFPKEIQINRPKDEYAIVLNVVKLDVNKPLEDAQFALERPEGTTLQVLGKPESGADAGADRDSSGKER
jgi:hypothetical protein